jgi:hypothetical protein
LVSDPIFSGPVIKDAAYWKTHARRHEGRARINYEALLSTREVLSLALQDVDTIIDNRDQPA